MLTGLLVALVSKEVLEVQGLGLGPRVGLGVATRGSSILCRDEDCGKLVYTVLLYTLSPKP